MAMEIVVNKVRGKIGGKKVNSTNINLYNISDQEKHTEIIETKEYLRKISFDGNNLSWTYEHMLSLGHAIKRVKVGVMGTTEKRKSSGQKIVLVNGKSLDIKVAQVTELPSFDILVRNAIDFNGNIKRIYAQGDMVIHLKDEIVLTAIVTEKNGIKYHWERISMGESTKSYKMILAQVDKIKISNLSAARRKQLLTEVGHIAINDACVINTVPVITTPVVCGR